MDKQTSPDLPVPVARPAPPVAGDAGGAGGLPFGLGAPVGVGAVLRALWSLRSDPVYAARLLSQSVGDGCGLGSWGMDHPVLPGRHLCPNRVARIRQELADGLVPADVLNVAPLRERPRPSGDVGLTTKEAPFRPAIRALLGFGRAH